jgi:hypothetical protein
LRVGARVDDGARRVDDLLPSWLKDADAAWLLSPVRARMPQAVPCVWEDASRFVQMISSLPLTLNIDSAT